MRKFTFLIILLLIIFYGIFSNYKSKIDRNAANFVNSQKDSNTKKEFGCTNEGGIISSSYCRFSEKNCREYFLSEYFGYLNNLSTVFHSKIIYQSNYDFFQFLYKRIYLIDNQVC